MTDVQAVKQPSFEYRQNAYFMKLMSVWEKMEGLYNPNDNGHPAYLGVHFGYNPEMARQYEMAKTAPSNMQESILRDIAYKILYYKYYLNSARKGEFAHTHFLYQNAWRTKGSMELSLSYIDYTNFYSPYELIWRIGTKNITDKQLLHRIGVYCGNYTIKSL